MDRRIEFSVFTMPFGWRYPELRAVFQEAERLGFESIWHHDDIMGHSPHVPLDVPLLDVWTALSALAEATSDIRIGSLATPAPRRYPPLLAKVVASLDNISGGRVNLGLGAGDDASQYKAWGQPFPAAAERVTMLRELIEIQLRMWTQERASFEGKYFRIENAVLSPKPVQKPHPPIWIAISTGTKLMPRVAAEYASGVVVESGDDNIVVQVARAVEKNCEELYRDISEITMARFVWIIFTDGKMDFETMKGKAKVILGHGLPFTGHVGRLILGTPSQIIDELPRLTLDLGFRHVIVNTVAVGLEVDTGGLEDPAGNFLGAMRLFAQEVMPAIK